MGGGGGGGGGGGAEAEGGVPVVLVLVRLIMSNGPGRHGTARLGTSPYGTRAAVPCRNRLPCLAEGPSTVRGPFYGPCQPVEHEAR